MLITFSGLDGAGKSTLIERFTALVADAGRDCCVRSMYFHCSLYAQLRRLRDLVPSWRPVRGRAATAATQVIPNKERPDVRDQSTWVARRVYGCFRGRSVRRIALFGDLVLFVLYRLWVEGVRGRMLVMDRYFYDSLADIVAHEKSRWGFVRIFLACCPTPDLSVFVDVPPEVAFERKREYPIEYMRWRREVYQKIFARVKDPLILENRDLEQTTALFRTAVIPRFAVHRNLNNSRLADSILRLLLGAPCRQDDWALVDWNVLLAIARKNCILIRTLDALKKIGVALPPHISAAAELERRRTAAVLKVTKRTCRLFLENSISFVLPAGLQHFPDMGGDVDLLVFNGLQNVDELLRQEFGAKRLPRGLLQRIATESVFQSDGLLTSIEVHRGRIGLAGEHRVFPMLMLEHRTVVSFDGVDIPIPSLEDRLLYQAIHRLYGRFYYRISDVLFSVTLLRGTTLDWDYLFRTAMRIGVADGLGHHLCRINRLCSGILGRSLLPQSVESFAERCKAKQLVFKRSYYRYPMFAFTAKLYLSKVVDDLRSARFVSTLRLFVVPALAVIVLMRNVLGRKSRYFSGAEKWREAA